MLNLKDYFSLNNKEKKENLFIFKSKLLKKKRISLKNLNEKEQDQNTKKRFENKLFNNENINILNNNNKKPSNFSKKLNKIVSNHLKTKNFNIEKIYFEDDFNKKIINFNLFNDNFIYDSNPFNEKIIEMNRDDDVLSDEELIKNSQLFLFKEINYAIKIYVDKKLKNNNKKKQ